MEETLPKFRYLHETSQYWYDTVPTACVVCGEKQPGYVFMDVSSESYETHTLCEPCLLGNRLGELRMVINNPDAESLWERLAELHPELSADEQDVLFTTRTLELMQRTPRPDICNLFVWHVHCDDYLTYFYDDYLTYFYKVDADALNALAPDGDGKAFLKSHLLPEEDERKDAFFEEAWEDSLEGFHSFYLWQCSCCSEYVLTCTSE